MNNNINQLLPLVAKKAQDFIDECKKQLGVTIIITESYRSPERQNELYAQGRTTKGQIVTNAIGGNSIHQYKCAFDIVPLIGGKMAWNYDFKKLGAIGTACGLEWGGNWKTFIDMPHFQYTAGYTLQDFKNGIIDLSKFNIPKVGTLPTNINKNMKDAYKFTNKETGEVKFGILHTAGEGFDIFRTVDGSDIRVENVDMKGDNFTNETYTVELVHDYEGELPTWSTE